MVKRFSKKHRNKERAFNYTLNLKVMSRCLSVPDATSLHHCLQNHSKYFKKKLDIKRPVERRFVTPYYSAMVVLFQAFPASWGNNQSYAGIRCTILNCA